MPGWSWWLKCPDEMHVPPALGAPYAGMQEEEAAVSDLIERLERATGPDRELDAEIMFDLYAKPVGKHAIDGGPTGYLWPEDNASWSFGIRFPGKDRKWFLKQRGTAEKETLLIERDGALVLMNDLRIPPLTASIDAALSLVPEGMDWEVCNLRSNEHLNGFVMWENTDNPDEYISRMGSHKVAAIALCIAALKARRKLP